jgi:FkbM family methyltransferase
MYPNFRAVRPLLRLLHHPGQPEGAIEAIVSHGGDRRLIVNTQNLVEWDIFFTGFEPEVRRVICSSIKPGHDAIDIGANGGVHTVEMARAAGKGSVLACEPNPQAQSRLQQNLALNGIKNVVQSNAAVLDKEGPVTLYVPQDSQHAAGASLYAGMHKQLRQNRAVTVAGTTIDKLVSSYGLRKIDLIKIDVEGFEGPVLRGGRETLRSQHPKIIFEYTRDWWNKLGYSLPQVTNDLRAIGYTGILQLSRNGPRRLPRGLPGRMNVLAEFD